MPPTIQMRRQFEDGQIAHKNSFLRNGVTEFGIKTTYGRRFHATHPTSTREEGFEIFQIRK